MDNYAVLYSSVYEEGITLVVVVDFKEKVELSNVCSRIYRSYFKENENLKIYFFKSSSTAFKFIYFKFISENKANISLSDLECSAYLNNNKLSFLLNDTDIANVVNMMN